MKNYSRFIVKSIKCANKYIFLKNICKQNEERKKGIYKYTNSKLFKVFQSIQSFSKFFKVFQSYYYFLQLDFYIISTKISYFHSDSASSIASNSSSARLSI